MNLKKFIYVSPQQYSQSLKSWRYEYIRNGEFLRTRPFGYHEGKEIILSLELDAWRNDQRVRMLNQFEWRDLRCTLLGGNHADKDGNKLIFHSMSQYEKFMKISSRTETAVKVLRQLHGGEIVLQHLYQHEGEYLGYLTIIGTRGGISTEHGYSVGYQNGEPYLTRTIGPLFELQETRKIEDQSTDKGQLPLLSF